VVVCPDHLAVGTPEAKGALSAPAGLSEERLLKISHHPADTRAHTHTHTHTHTLIHPAHPNAARVATMSTNLK
jgi:hypothetical protein